MHVYENAASKKTYSLFYTKTLPLPSKSKFSTIAPNSSNSRRPKRSLFTSESQDCHSECRECFHHSCTRRSSTPAGVITWLLIGGIPGVEATSFWRPRLCWIDSLPVVLASGAAVGDSRKRKGSPGRGQVTVDAKFECLWSIITVCLTKISYVFILPPTFNHLLIIHDSETRWIKQGDLTHTYNVGRVGVSLFPPRCALTVFRKWSP